MGLKRLSLQDLPPGVRTSATNIAGGGRLYTFSHVTLGELGRLRVVPHGPTQIEASAEVAPGDPDAPDWVEKFALLDQVIETCLNALLGSRDTKPFPSMEEVHEERRLYRRFLAAQHSIQMFGFAKSLSEQEYQTVVKVAQGTLTTADPLTGLGSSSGSANCNSIGTTCMNARLFSNPGFPVADSRKPTRRTGFCLHR